jgi:hypothetical protein
VVVQVISEVWRINFGIAGHDDFVELEFSRSFFSGVLCNTERMKMIAQILQGVHIRWLYIVKSDWNIRTTTQLLKSYIVVRVVVVEKCREIFEFRRFEISLECNWKKSLLLKIVEGVHQDCLMSQQTSSREVLSCDIQFENTAIVDECSELLKSFLRENVTATWEKIRRIRLMSVFELYLTCHVAFFVIFRNCSVVGIEDKSMTEQQRHFGIVLQKQIP